MAEREIEQARRETLHEARFTNREALGIYLGWSERRCAGRLCRILLQCGGALQPATGGYVINRRTLCESSEVLSLAASSSPLQKLAAARPVAARHSDTPGGRIEKDEQTLLICIRRRRSHGVCSTFLKATCRCAVRRISETGAGKTVMARA